MLYFIQLYICRPTYIVKVVKIAYLSDDLTVGILNLNDDMIEYRNYVQPNTLQENPFSVDIGTNIAQILV